MNNIKIVALDNIKEIGLEVNVKLNKLRKSYANFMKKLGNGNK